MKRSPDRILTTHCGSLARPRDLLELMDAKLNGKPSDLEAYARRVRSAVHEVVRKQLQCDVVWAKFQAMAAGARLATKKLWQSK